MDGFCSKRLYTCFITFLLKDDLLENLNVFVRTKSRDDLSENPAVICSKFALSFVYYFFYKQCKNRFQNSN